MTMALQNQISIISIWMERIIMGFLEAGWSQPALIIMTFTADLGVTKIKYIYIASIWMERISRP